MNIFKNKKLNFLTGFKMLEQEGNLVYGYNPFHNYRLNESKIELNGKLYSFNEFTKYLNTYFPGNNYQFVEENGKWKLKSGNKEITNWNTIFKDTTPIVHQKGELVDFDTEQLQFSINNPVNILPQWSYDNSVNLILNDGKNSPRLINSRFSSTERNKYQICDRKGNNDSNIYDQGEQFDTDISLYKKITNIPKIKFMGVGYGGNLSIGNYHFYFRYTDEDGNESDFFAESGLVSIFIGNTPDSIYSGFEKENAHKLVRFKLSNTDPGYDKVNIYYTKATSASNGSMTTQAFRVDRNFKLSEVGSTIITITGFEEADEISMDEINIRYQIYGNAETQAAAQNILFLGNLEKPKLEYEDFIDISLRFMPKLDTSVQYNSKQIGVNYTGSITNTYYDPNFIYNYTGYHDDEIYRFGIVYILSDNTLTDVFNVRGTKDLSLGCTFKPLYDNDKKRIYLSYDEQYYNLKEGNDNAKGVVYIPQQDQDNIIGIKFEVEQDVIDYLKETLKVKGFFFVRQKRIPTTLCQAYLIGVDKQSNTPVIPYKLDENNTYITEGFLDKNRELGGSDRLLGLQDLEVRTEAAICPEYDVNSSYLNNLFTGSNFIVSLRGQKELEKDTDYHYYVTNYNNLSDSYRSTKILGVEDNVKLVAIGNSKFSGRAGEAEEAFRYEYVGKENVEKEAQNLIRGSYGPYIGITGLNNPNYLMDIKIPGYSTSNMDEYFEIRYHDKSPFYAISYRYDINDNIFTQSYSKKREVSEYTNVLQLKDTLYRGDCYICQFTHRLNRNFQDPTSPTNDKIVNSKCWKDNYDVSDGIVKVENFNKINLGDVNAVCLGLYITLKVRSSINLNIRSLDNSIPEEVGLFGHGRGFYPYFQMDNSGAYKIPEALCYNKGFEKSVSERVNIEVPDVPWIKNEFSNRIAYSNVQVRDAFENGWRTFLGTHYRDYPKTYGSITKLIELGGNLICVFEHGVALIPVNERVVAGEGDGGSTFITTKNVLPENPKVLSNTFGSQWRDSVIKTPTGIYGVDTVAKKIWKTDGNNFVCISDETVSDFLNNNISLSERELEPIIGIRNVKTHYNKFKQDIMFTFYDNLYGFEEKVWNLCYNEVINKFVTFYSWVPGCSENIYNQYFSFDRNTSKQIAKLGTSCTNNSFADGVTLSSVRIDEKEWSAKLSLSNRTLPKAAKCNISYTLERDNLGNNNYFRIYEENSEYYLKLKDGVTYEDINKLGVILLNIRAIIEVSYNGTATKEDLFSKGVADMVAMDAGYYQSVVAVTTKDNWLKLTTDFWKHGKAGIIDISEEILPTKWYGKQHPFEFEFIVNKNQDYHKIFDCLEIIGNNAEPESFHYEIVGDCFDFAHNKQNMYIRQEATKELYQYNGLDNNFDKSYKNLKEEPSNVSTLFPLYYYRLKHYNNIEDYYHLKDGTDTKDYSSMAGCEVIKYNRLNEYRLCNHVKAIDLNKNNRIISNMQYNEDKWKVQLTPINLAQANEKEGLPIVLNYNVIPNEIKNNKINLDNPTGRKVVMWNKARLKQVKLKDKWIKIRIRYSGQKLAVIYAVKTIYSLTV